jgi:hypothetical protein
MRKIVLIICFSFLSVIGFSQCTTLVDSYDAGSELYSYSCYAGLFIGFGQSFTVSSSIKLCSCKFLLKKTGYPTGNVYAYLFTHSGVYGSSSVPTGLALAISDPYDVSTIPNSAGTWITFTFSGANQYAMSAGYYCIEFNNPGGDGSNYVNQFVCNSSCTASGNASYDYGGYSAYPNGDTFFYVYGSAAAPPATISPLIQAVY